MNPEIRSLLRQEWHQRRTSLVICTGWMLCCAVYCLAYEWRHQFHGTVAAFYTSSLMYLIFAAVFLAMRTALGEQTRGTMGFSLSLPVARERLAWIRLAGGATTLIMPVVIGALIMTPFLVFDSVEQAPVRPPTPYVPMQQRSPLSAANAVGLLWTVTAIACAAGLQLLIILSIFGARRRSESHIGFFGAVLGLIWFLLASIRGMFPALNGWVGALFPVSFIVNYSYGGDEGSYTDLDLGRPVWLPLAANVFVLSLLAVWYAHRYGTGSVARESGRVFGWRRWPAVWSRIPVPMPGRGAALVWYNLRQSIPMAVFGLILAALVTMVQFAQFELGQSFRSQLPSNTWFVATLWAVVVGVGVFAAELQPGLGSFWRSRPISVGSWFWCKYFTGLLAVLLVLDGVTIFVSWGTTIGHTTGLSSSYIACMPILHATLYAMAVLGICILRHPILGGTLAIAGYFVTSTLITSLIGDTFEPISIHNSLLTDEMIGQFDLRDHNYPVVYGTLVAIIFTSAWLASRAVRHAERRSILFGRPNMRAAA